MQVAAFNSEGSLKSAVCNIRAVSLQFRTSPQAAEAIAEAGPIPPEATEAQTLIAEALSPTKHHQKK